MVALRALRGRIYLCMVGVVVVALGAVASVILVAELSLRRAMATEAAADVAGAGEALAVRLRLAEERIASEARVVADEPRLKAALTTVGMDRATMDDIADDLRQTARWDLVAILGPEGDVRGRSGGAGDTGLTEAKGTWRSASEVFLVTSARVAFGSRLVATLVAGVKMTDERLTDAMPGTRGKAVIFLDKDVIAATFAKDSPARGELGKLAGGAATEVDLAGERFLVRAVPFGAAGMKALALASIDAAEAPLAAVRRGLFIVGGVAGLVVIVVGWLLGRGLARASEKLLARPETPPPDPARWFTPS